MNSYRKQSIQRIVIFLFLTVSFLMVAPTYVTAENQVRFAAIGDYGSGSQNEGAVANLIDSWSVDFVITAGDNHYGNTTFDQVVGQFYCDFFKDALWGDYCSDPIRTSNAFFPSLGNHDYSDGSGVNEYLSYFTLPGSDFISSSNNERYYDFVWGPVHFFAINSNSHEPDGTSSSSVQALWLQNQLAASTTPWQIVYFHHGAYSSANHGNTAYMQWPFAAWGADVVIAGHDHTYERINMDGIVYFVNGLGGMSIYTCGSPVTGSQICYDDDYGAMLIEASESNINFQFINYAGAVIDTYNIVRIIESSDDLVYTPVTPCRIVDTRKAGGAISANGIRNYNVRGAVAYQGGNSAGCPSPKGESRAVHINVTSVPLGNGWITAYPYGSTAPTASLVNYRSDAQNVANSGTIKTCFNCTKDINIKSGGGKTHVIIDVLGYYYAAP